MRDFQTRDATSRWSIRVVPSLTTPFFLCRPKIAQFVPSKFDCKKHILVRVAEIQEEQLAIHQQATDEAAANAKVTIESLIAEAEAARVKATSDKGGGRFVITDARSETRRSAFASRGAKQALRQWGAAT
jgi:hypothetical protein